jgi:citrate lyase subunit beta/citryl-CoA lyase
MALAAEGPAPVHPRLALYEPGEPVPRPLPVCDHYAGVEARMRKALALQGELGPVFDLTLDCEDGAPVGGEADHAALVAEIVNAPANLHGRVGARVHPVAHPAFAQEAEVLVRHAGARLAYLMLPKPEGRADVDRACAEIDRLSRTHGVERQIPVHVLIETHGALREVQAIAAHPRVESLSFGLMDFVSAHRGAVPASAMGMPGQFEHPLVCRAKLEIAAAAHGHGKTPSHNVVTEFKNPAVLADAVQRAARQFGYTRMWSIHPDQIRVIVDGFAPEAHEVALAGDVLLAAQAASWGPVAHQQTLHDRASYRYFWQVLQQAHKTGRLTDATVRAAFFG